MAWTGGAYPPELKVGEHVFAIDFHPKVDIIATGDVLGRTQLWKFTPEGHERVSEDSGHKGASRALAFSLDGSALFSGSSDNTVRALDIAQGQHAWALPTGGSVNCLRSVDETALASGDDEGCIKMWDVRKQKHVFEMKVHEDFVSDMLVGPDGYTFISSSGDGTLGVYDLRKRGKSIARSEHQESDLLSMCLVKGNKKVLVGTGAGELGFFSWGDWGDITDRFPGHPDSVDAVLRVDDCIVCTASNDGFIRAISIFPNKLIGVVGDHGGDPVEALALDRSRAIMGSCAHDGSVRFWNMRFLLDEDEEEGGGIGIMEGVEMKAVDDESSEEEGWEDVEEEEEGGGKGKEKLGNDFFADL